MCCYRHLRFKIISSFGSARFEQLMTALQSLIELPKLSKQNKNYVLSKTMYRNEKKRDPILDKKKCQFSLLFSDVASKVHTSRQKLCQRIRIFLFLSSSFGIETTNTFLHSGNSLENHTRFQTKMSKVWTVFNRPKKRKKKHTLWGGTYLYGWYKEISPGRKSKYLRNSVRGPGCPLNTSFGRETLKRKELVWRVDNQTVQRPVIKKTFERLSSGSEKGNDFHFSMNVMNGSRLRRELVTI